MVGRRPTDAQRAPDRIDIESAEPDGRVEHGAQVDLGLALTVQALAAQHGEHLVNPTRREFADARRTDLR